ncbi:unnamed protein product [Meganyctiphanes norvegica]|uniref:UDP-N-acetylglucosamine transferase subunit ALG14 n=1 Tax=Meganyctiphanes norvegica TaxID=48144 RepID=A0AAV2PLR5_MEGNR
MMFFSVLLLFILFMFGRIIYVFYKVLYSQSQPYKIKYKTVNTLVVLGSGGHTGEMLKIISGLDSKKFAPRIYVAAESDSISIMRLQEMESREEEKHEYTVEVIPRSREVGQSWISSAFTTVWALMVCFRVVWHHRPDLIITNGPGTCVPICAVAFILHIFGVIQPRQIFIESVCRVKSLSLSGHILYWIVDDLFVQWPYLKNKYPRLKYMGRII